MSNRYTLDLKPVAGEGAIIRGETWRFTVLTDSLIRMEYQSGGRFVDEPTQTALCRDFPVPEYRVMDRGDRLEIVTEKLHIYYNKKAFSGEGLTVHLKEGFHVYGSVWRFGDSAGDLRGTACTLDGADGAVALDHGLMSRDGFTVLDDSRSMLLGEDQWLCPKDWDSTDLYFFGYGHDYLRCLRDFYRLSGFPPMLPRYALGNWWSRFYRYTEDSYLELMERFRARALPFSVAVIDMDWHLTELPARYGSGWTGYTWNRDLFPEPERFLNELHERGLHVTLNVHPADGVRAFEEAYLPMAKELGIDWRSGDKIPFNAADRAFLEAYFRYLHHPDEARGVDFWWVDWQQGSRTSDPRIDTLWVLNHQHFLDIGRRGGKRPLILSRYAGIGSHRYPVGFSGDSFSTWASLDFQPYFTANASNVGYTWWSHDIGGHQGGRRDDELAVRWLQFGVFSPVLRLHSTSNLFFGKEPWNYSGEAEGIMSEFLRLRHRLIPYLYTMNRLNHTDGLPLMRPMYYHHDAPEAYDVPNEYYYGTEMIVCPITAPADPETRLAEFDAWLPEGTYMDFFTGCLYRGGRRLRLFRGLDSIPVLVRAGGIVPLAADYMTSHLENPEELEVHVFHGADGAFRLYEDRCDAEQEDAYAVTVFRYASGAVSAFSMRIEGDPAGIIPPRRRYDIHIRGIDEPAEIRFAEPDVPFTKAYDARRKELRLRFPGEGRRAFRISLRTERAEPAAPDPRGAVYDILQRARISYDLKARLYRLICSGHDRFRLFGELFAEVLPAPLENAIIEQLIAND